MTREEIAKELLDALAELRVRLASRIAPIAASIETDQQGNIISSPENIARVGVLVARMKDEFVDDDLREAVDQYVATLDGTSRAVIDSFSDFDGVDRGVLDAITQRYKDETTAFLTNPDTYNETLWGPITNGIILGAATGAALEATIESVVNIATESNIVGQAESVTVSAPLMLQRTQTAAAAEQTGAKFFYFQGRPIATTRPWCREREGKYWHIEEIRQWGRDASNGDGWDGMVEGTNEQTIFVHLGGWYGERNSCRHVLVPVLRSKVPESDLARMREKGLL